MRKRIKAILLLIVLIFGLTGCPLGKDSYFSIVFIDVGQGDAALVECDGEYMLIDGGPKSAGDAVYEILEDRGIQHINILAISHLHEDHIGGLSKALHYASKIDLTIANSDGMHENSESFADFNKTLHSIGSEITVPDAGDKYKLGSAIVEVIDVSSEKNNDSLVLLITYGKTRFLFTGDIEASGQERLRKILSEDKRQEDGVFQIDLIKIPHHGAYNDEHGVQNSNLNALIYVTEPRYAVISVGKNNGYNHPHKCTLDLLKQADVEVLRTDEQGNITVKSDGEYLKIEPAR